MQMPLQSCWALLITYFPDATMESRNKNIMGQLKNNILSSSQGDIKRVVQEAQTEALSEAKTMLKERMLEAILKNAIGKVDKIKNEPVVLVVEEE